MSKIAVVIGASSGIGQAAAVAIAARGTGVVLTYNSNADGATATVAQIEASGGTAVALPLDIGRSETFTDFAERLEGALRTHWGRGTFDSLVCNAGVGQSALIGDMTEELFDRLHRILFKGPYFLTQALLPMIADGGAIVNTTSSSTRPNGVEVGYSAYASNKGALTTLTRYLAKELGPRRIRVNSIAPGPTQTRLGRDYFERIPDEIVQPMADRTALGRIGEPDDVGKVIAAMVSDDWAWITGEDIEVSGGYCL